MNEEHTWGDTSRWVRAGVIAWTLIGVVIIGYGIAVALGRVSSAIAPLVVGILIVLVLKAPVAWLERKGLHRTMATAIVYSVAVAVLVGLLIWVIPTLASQASEFSEDFPVFYGEAVDFFGQVRAEYDALQIPGWAETMIERFNDAITSSTSDVSGQLATGVIAAGGAIVSGVVSLFAGLVIGFLLLVGLPKVGAGLLGLVPPKGRHDAVELAHRINEVVGGFIKGQGLIALIVGVLTGVTMALLGVPFAGMIGVIAGVTNIVPYVGPVVGGAVAAIVALFIDPWLAVWAIVAVIVIQQVESMFLSPKIMSDKVGIHPVIVIVTLLAGASLGGLVGMLLAIPIAGTIKVTWNYFAEKAGWDKPTPEDLEVIGIHLGHTAASHDDAPSEQDSAQ